MLYVLKGGEYVNDKGPSIHQDTLHVYPDNRMRKTQLIAQNGKASELATTTHGAACGGEA